MIFILLIGCTQEDKTLKGVSLSPRTSGDEDFLGFFEKSKQTGNMVMWAGDWNELPDGAPKVVTELSSTYGYTPIIEVTYYSQGDGQLIRPFNETIKELYKNKAIEFAEKYKPKYLGLGIEVNIMYEKSPDDFEDFVIFYDEVYDTVKEVSPNTKVFTVFQLEKMKGLTFWSDGTLNSSKAQWFLLDRFDSDLAVFSTYPGLVYKDPSEIPADYYTEITLHTDKPIAFTEMGWHSAASPQGWESSEEEQAEFITTFFNLTKDLNKEIIIWSFMYDPDTIEPFNSMGLRNSDGTAKSAWNVWITAE